MNAFRLAACLTAVFLAPTWALAQSIELQGSVTDLTGAPVRGATVAISAGDWRDETQTDRIGHFTLSIPSNLNISLIIVTVDS